ncbi:MAG TPA: hypothetical protein VFI34_07530 [Candidatus Limnocylindrales bacterium]|nr:hypothetical protein [Candidatus Limnocylindrales bacterium]
MSLPAAPLQRGPASHVNERGIAKIGYPSRKAARAAGRQLIPRVGWKLSEYRCAECSEWHLSKSIRRRDEP